MSRSYRTAVAKMLQESLEDSEPGSDDYALWEELTFDHSSKKSSIEFLEKKLQERQKKSKERFNGMKSSFVDVVVSDSRV